MKLSRSPMFYIFTIPFTTLAGIGMYTVYNSSYGQYFKSQGFKCFECISDAANKTYTSTPHNWVFRTTQTNKDSDDSKKPPPMPY